MPATQKRGERRRHTHSTSLNENNTDREASYEMSNQRNKEESMFQARECINFLK